MNRDELHTDGMVMGMGGSEVAWWEDSISIRVWEVVWNMEG